MEAIALLVCDSLVFSWALRAAWKREAPVFGTLGNDETMDIESTIQRLLTIRDRIVRFPDEHTQTTAVLLIGGGLERLREIRSRVDDAVRALRTGLDPRGHPITPPEVGNGLKRLVADLRERGWLELMPGVVVAEEGIRALQELIEELSSVANGLQGLQSSQVSNSLDLFVCLAQSFANVAQGIRDMRGRGGKSGKSGCLIAILILEALWFVYWYWAMPSHSEGVIMALTQQVGLVVTAVVLVACHSIAAWMGRGFRNWENRVTSQNRVGSAGLAVGPHVGETPEETCIRTVEYLKQILEGMRRGVPFVTAEQRASMANRMLALASSLLDVAINTVGVVRAAYCPLHGEILIILGGFSEILSSAVDEGVSTELQMQVGRTARKVRDQAVALREMLEVEAASGVPGWRNYRHLAERAKAVNETLGALAGRLSSAPDGREFVGDDRESVGSLVIGGGFERLRTQFPEACNRIDDALQGLMRLAPEIDEAAEAHDNMRVHTGEEVGIPASGRDSKAIIADALEEHHNRIKMLHRKPGYEEFERRFDRLLCTGVLRFAVDSVDAALASVILLGGFRSHDCKRRRFDGLYVAVSTLPAAEPSSSRSYFGSGYLSFVEELLQESGHPQGDVDCAHWVFCLDPDQERGVQAVHLTFVPSKAFLGAGGPAGHVWPVDLLTEAERAEIGLVPPHSISGADAQDPGVGGSSGSSRTGPTPLAPGDIWQFLPGGMPGRALLESEGYIGASTRVASVVLIPASGVVSNRVLIVGTTVCHQCRAGFPFELVYLGSPWCKLLLEGAECPCGNSFGYDFARRSQDGGEALLVSVRAVTSERGRPGTNPAIRVEEVRSISAEEVEERSLRTWGGVLYLFREKELTPGWESAHDRWPDFSTFAGRLARFNPLQRRSAWFAVASAVAPEHPVIKAKCYAELLLNDPDPELVCWNWLERNGFLPEGTRRTPDTVVALRQRVGSILS